MYVYTYKIIRMQLYVHAYKRKVMQRFKFKWI